MAYDTKFFEMYAKYLREPTVRKSHDAVFRAFKAMCRTEEKHVVDLGCGLGEYCRYGASRGWEGIDRNDMSRDPHFLGTKGRFHRPRDYMELDFVDDLAPAPGAFVSLFSIEACFPVEERYAFYERLFQAIPSLDCGLTAGFYYESKRDQPTVGETGGIVSHQTIEPIDAWVSELFDEARVITRTPSEMFGPDVIEVWKILTRK